MGVAHVASPDHLSALATLSSNGGLGAFALGVRWGVGHSTGMIFAALALMAATLGGDAAIRSASSSEGAQHQHEESAAATIAMSLAWSSNLLVGITMIGIGLRGG